MERIVWLYRKWFVHYVSTLPNNNDSIFPLHTKLASEVNQSYSKSQNASNKLVCTTRRVITSKRQKCEKWAFDICRLQMAYLPVWLKLPVSHLIASLCWVSPWHPGDETAKELLSQGLGQAAACQRGLVYDHGAVEQVGTEKQSQQLRLRQNEMITVNKYSMTTMTTGKCKNSL